MNRTKLYVGQFDQLPMSVVQGQLKLLHQYDMVHFGLHIMAASLLCATIGMNTQVSYLLMLIWYVAVVLFAIARWFANSRFAKNGALSYEQLMEIIQRYRFFSMVLSTVWGISGVILFFDNAQVQSLHVALLLLVCVSIWPMLIISRAEFYTQVVLLLLPMALMLAMQSDLKTSLLGGVAIAFAGMTILVTHSVAQILNHLFDTQQSLLEQIHTDPVTQLINRSHFDQAFKTEWRRSARHGHSLALMLVEIDDFQKIEARGGISGSDQYLQVITHCLKSVARRGSDILARYGRSEFIALLPSSKLEEALVVAERLRKDVENAQLTDSDMNSKIISVTIGVSACYPTVSPLDEREEGEFSSALYPAVLLSSADRALQRGKRNGKNRVEYEACGEGNPNLTTVYRD